MPSFKLQKSELNSRVAILKTIGLFSSVQDEVLNQIAEVLIPKQLAENEILFNQEVFDNTL